MLIGVCTVNIKKELFFYNNLYNMSQTEEEFLADLTQSFPDDSVDEEEEEEDDDESGEREEEENEEQGRKELQNSIRRKSFHSTTVRRADIATMVNALQREGGTHSFCISSFMSTVYILMSDNKSS